jgi:Flp pilus assembly protein TadD
LRTEDAILARVVPTVLIILAGLAAYSNSFAGVFILDDQGEIVTNEDIRGLLPVSRWIHDPRPVVKLSLAINYALGGLRPAGYHAVNLLIHILAGLCLFGIARRTLLRVGWKGAEARWAGLVIALLWLVHPLQTQGVTYVVQRAESLMGLFYLLTVYCFIRRAERQDRTAGDLRFEILGPAWGGFAVAACALGMATKAVMVTAPILILLYDRVFVAKSFREALRMRPFFYAALAGTWAVLASLGVMQGVWGSGQSGTVTVGFATSGVSAWQYLLTQTGVILHYIRLFFWPYPLCLDYWWPMATLAREVLLPGLVVLGLLIATGYAFYRRPTVGFLGVAFFILLAPTSSFVPVKDAIFEHRMYLPLAALAALVVIGARKVVGRLPRVALAGVIIIGLAGMTYVRNRDYQSEVRMWSDVVRQYPSNARAQSSLGVALAMEGRMEEAIGAYRAAVAADPDHVEARGNLGKALSKLGRYEEAIEHFERALAKDPTDVAFRNSYAVALGRVGRHAEEIAQYQEVIRRDWDHPLAHYNLATALGGQNQVAAAIGEYREVIRITPGDFEARKNLGDLLMRAGQMDAAAAEYRRALEINPGYGPARAALELVERAHSGS